MIDPELERWNRKYPTFPGVDKCVELLGSRNVKGSWVDIICSLLEQHAAECFDDLLRAFRAERDPRVRRLLLYAIASAGSPEVIPFLTDCLQSEDHELRYLAAWNSKPSTPRRLEPPHRRGCLRSR